MKDKVVGLLSKELKLDVSDVDNLIEVPPKDEMGDYAFPCFGLAKSMKKSPVVVAEDLVKKVRKKLPKEIASVDSLGPYINFFIDKKILAERVLERIGKSSFGNNDSEKGKIICIDMSSPNIAKPFGIGHLRSTIIGNSIGKIAEANGCKVVRINYLGDWGTQFGKIILAYKKWGSEEKLKKETVAHLQELYVKINKNDSLDDEARAEFKKLESGDKENLKLWEKFRKLSIGKFDEIYDLLGVNFDVVSGESEYNDKMDNVVEELKSKGLVKEDQGALICDLKDYGLGVALVQKSDGTSLYVTRDIAAVKDRKKKYNFDKMIYEVGQEQRLHFKQLFKILEKLGYKWSEDCFHVAHGLYLDTDGKKFATRKGKVVYMKDILNEVIDKAKKNLLKREKLDDKELELRAKKIALAAILYGDLKNNRENNIVFDVDKFLSFEGDTGPYLLYTYARASSIIKKVKSKTKVEVSDLDEIEVKLLKKIDGFEDIIKRAYDNFSPNLVANYSFELAQIFNEFYHSCPVLGSKSEGLRLKLVDAFRVTLKKSLDLLGIGVVEEM